MTDLTILNTPIRTHGTLYCLNDLHKAAGGEKRHQPANWLRIDQTKELIEEIENSSDMRSKAVIAKEGRNGGTYACKELVYAYASWISPKFYLRVLRAFDALVEGRVTDAQQIATPRLTNASAESFIKRWLDGGIGLPVTACLVADLYHAYAQWSAAQERQYTAPRKTFSSILRRHTAVTRLRYGGDRHQICFPDAAAACGDWRDDIDRFKLALRGFQPQPVQQPTKPRDELSEATMMDAFDLNELIAVLKETERDLNNTIGAVQYMIQGVNMLRRNTAIPRKLIEGVIEAISSTDQAAAEKIRATLIA